jgi:hypothetical protein
MAPRTSMPYAPTTIIGVSDVMFEYGGEEYYQVDLDGYYWVDILVHSTTGELLCAVEEESDEPVPPVVEPLNDYYNRFY